MTQPRENGRAPKSTAGFRRRGLLRVGLVGLVLVAGIDYLRGIDLRPDRLLVPLRELTVSPALANATELPWRAGALSGQNLVLVTLDTTRPDRLGCYGGADSVSPHLDQLARDGVLFSNAVAVGSTTLPTHASILTGLYPPRHGAAANSVFRLDDRHRTLAERLSDRGYATAAFVSAFVLDAQFGLQQGFGHYDDGSMQSEGISDLHFPRRRADDTTDRALAWLRAPRTGPFFLWVHYYDAHAPYQPPAPFDQGYENDYDGALAFVDQQLGRLLAEIESAPGAGTLVVVTADHGEALGEHGEATHGLLVQEATLRIPLVMRATKGPSGGLHVPTRTSQVDLVPTLLSLLGIAEPDAFDGVDLTAAETPAPDRLVFAETIEGSNSFGWASPAALYRGSYKYVEGPDPELYDLSRDPLERHDLAGAAEETAQMEVLSRQLKRLRGRSSDRVASRTTPSREDIERLEALGYVVSGGEAGLPSGAAPDPKDMLPLYNHLQELVGSPSRIEGLPLPLRVLAWISKDPWPSTTEALIRALEKLAEEHPDFAATHSFLARQYRSVGRAEEARLAQERLKGLLQPDP